MRANYRLEYIDKNGKRHDAFFLSIAMAELRFGVEIERGCKEVVLSRRAWKSIATHKQNAS